MKPLTIFLIFFFLPALMSNGQDIKINEVTIAGRIDNATRKTIGITSLEPIRGRQQYFGRLNEAGEFNITLHASAAHDYFISYGGLQTLFLEPGDSLYFTADENEFEGTIKFSGDNAEANRVLGLFFTSFGSLYDSQDFYTNKRELSPVEFKKFISSFFAKLDSVINSLQTKENDLNPGIVSWMKAYSKYRRAEDLFEYGQSCKEDLPPDYYDFMDDYAEKDPKDIQCSQYYEDFLGMYSPYKFSQYQNAETINAYREKGDYFSYLQSLMKEVAKNEVISAEVELILSKTCYRVANISKKSMAKAYPRYKQLVKNKRFRRVIREATGEQMYNEGKYKKLEQLAASDHIGEIFSAIKKKHNGKVLYLDFWGTWCKPCLAEFPYSKILHKELEDKDIEFIYFGCLSEEKAWKKIKNKYQLTGTHFLLNSDQYRAMANLFNINGLPRYMIINKEGVIVDGDAGRPSGKETKEKLLQLGDL